MITFKNHVQAALHLGASASFRYKTESKTNRQQDTWAFSSSKGTTEYPFICGVRLCVCVRVHV